MDHRIFLGIVMELQREQEFVSQYHFFDVRNFEWEKENGNTGNKADVNFSAD